MTISPKVIHARAIMNRGSILDANECGCFFCLHKYKPEEVKEWGDDDSTAVCPFCGVQAVLPNSDDYELTDKLLLEMKEYWF